MSVQYAYLYYKCVFLTLRPGGIDGIVLGALVQQAKVHKNYSCPYWDSRFVKSSLVVVIK